MNTPNISQQTKRPLWVAALDERDWLIDGRSVRGKELRAIFFALDWSKAWIDLGPSPANNPGPYWHVPRLDGDTTHRLYPKLIQTKWAGLLVQVARDAAKLGAKAARRKS